MDPLSLAASAGAVAAAAAGFGAGLRMRHRLRRTEGKLASLRHELAAERHAADHDPLTGLLNRRSFFRLGENLLADPGRPVLGCAVVDLNSFKQINDRFGHAAGDQVLVALARRLARFAGVDPVARLGGDEFAALFTEAGRASPEPRAAPASQPNLAEHLTELLGAPAIIAGRFLQVRAAVGVAPAHPGADLASLLQAADRAMYREKPGLPQRQLTPDPPNQPWGHQPADIPQLVDSALR